MNSWNENHFSYKTHDKTHWSDDVQGGLQCDLAHNSLLSAKSFQIKHYDSPLLTHLLPRALWADKSGSKGTAPGVWRTRRQLKQFQSIDETCCFPTRQPTSKGDKIKFLVWCFSKRFCLQIEKFLVINRSRIILHSFSLHRPNTRNLLRCFPAWPKCRIESPGFKLGRRGQLGSQGYH